MRLCNFRRALCGLLFCIPLTVANAQTVRYVNDDAHGANTGTSWSDAYNDLHSALAAAQPGDQIWVAAGRYVGNFTLKLGVGLYGGFAGTEAEMTQRNWKTNPTILDGNRTGSVVTAPSGATATTRIDGFTITNGRSGYGGGLYLYGSSPTIANNTITGNGAYSDGGGGVHLNNSSPTIANNTIADNWTWYHGGGLYVQYSSPTIASNTIIGNSATENGGGLYLFSSAPTLTSNTIASNSASNGGGLYGGFSPLTIANNTFSANSAADGGGLYLLASRPIVSGNTFANNIAPRGGAMFLNQSYSTIIANNIVAFNSSGLSGYSSALRNNCAYGNRDYDYSGVDNPTGTNGNISADPRFADRQYGRLHIQRDSPCVDAGSNADVYGDLDMDGQPRIEPPAGSVDIGADESDGTVWLAGPYVIVRVSPLGNDANDGSSWVFTKRTVQASIDAASAFGGEVWVQAGTYYERITLRSYSYVYGGFAGVETNRNQRDWGTNVTTLDGGQQGSVVTSMGSYGTSAIDGFTITGGTGTLFSNGVHHGGGVYLANSSPAIANNTITGNSASTSGGGVYMYQCASTLTRNTIAGNTAGSGGGLYVSNSRPTINCNTITSNSATSGGGGALFLDSSSATVTGNVITENRALQGGGVLGMFGSSGMITNNTISGNAAGSCGGLRMINSSPAIIRNAITGNTGVDGGGLCLANSLATLSDNLIANNKAFDEGGGVVVIGASPTVLANIVTGNSAQNGGGFYLYSSAPSIANTIITHNIAAQGAGLYLDDGASPSITSDTIAGNIASLEGGGLYLSYNSSPSIRNTIIASNSSGIHRYDVTGTPTLDYNCVYDNTGYNYSGLTDPTGTNGNISVDPMLVRNPSDGGDGWGDDPATPDVDEGANDDYGDLHLRGGSRAINTGDPGFVPQPGETDLDGHARVLCGRVDMGAYEFGIGDYDCDQSVDLTDFANWSACMTGPTGGTIAPGCEVFDFNADGDVDLLDFGGFQRIFGP